MKALIEAFEAFLKHAPPDYKATVPAGDIVVEYAGEERRVAISAWLTCTDLAQALIHLKEAGPREQGWLKNHADLIERVQLLEQHNKVLREHEAGWVAAHDAAVEKQQRVEAENRRLQQQLEREQKRPTYAREGRRFEAACAAIKGLMSQSTTEWDPKVFSRVAVQQADALIAELDKES